MSTEVRLIRRTDKGSRGAVAHCWLEDDGSIRITWDYGMGFRFKQGAPFTSLDEGIDAFIKACAEGPDSTWRVERTKSTKRKRP